MAPYLETAIQWLHDAIRCQIRAQREAAEAADPAIWVNLCWEVGHSLSMMQAHGIPAQPVIEAVSEKLVEEFGPEADWTPYGIRTMRQFYLDYFERPALQPLLRTVNWDCHKILLALCRDPAQQEFYLEMCRSQGLSAEALTVALKERRYEWSSAAVPKVPAKAGTKLVSKSPKGSRKGMGKALGKVANLGKAATRLLPRSGRPTTRLAPKDD